MRFIDLSHTIETLPEDLPSFMTVQVSYSDHEAGAVELEKGFGVPPRLLRNEQGPAGEHLSIGTHAGTHVEAPWHYNSTIQGKPAQTIDELPVDWVLRSRRRRRRTTQGGWGPGDGRQDGLLHRGRRS